MGTIESERFVRIKEQRNCARVLILPSQNENWKADNAVSKWNVLRHIRVSIGKMEFIFTFNKKKTLMTLQKCVTDGKPARNAKHLG